MKNVYGFDFFDDVINHEYDNESDNTKRFKMIVDTIQDINQNQDNIIKFFSSNKKRFEKNQKLVLDILKNKEDKIFLKKLIGKK